MTTFKQIRLRYTVGGFSVFPVDQASQHLRLAVLEAQGSGGITRSDLISEGDVRRIQSDDAVQVRFQRTASACYRKR